MESATHEIERRGIGRMFTASGSIYELDFEGGTLCRVSVESPVPAPGQPISLPLRRDGEVLRVLEIVQLRLYRRAIFVLEPLGPPPSVYYAQIDHSGGRVRAGRHTEAGALAVPGSTWASMNINPYGVCVKFRDGEMNSDELVALMAAWPFGPMPRTNDTNVIRATPWPGNVGCLYLALLDGVISEQIIRSIARGHTAHQARDGRVVAAALTGSEGGTWRVTTVGSRHLFDLEDFTIQRTAIVHGTPLRSGPLKRLTVLDSCRLFQTGLWTFHSEKTPSWIEWHQSSIIMRIERLR